jgi:REP element-mobilizing transposase RayT
MRCSRRHPTFDYSSPGGYFVTICVNRARFPIEAAAGPRISGILASVEIGRSTPTQLGEIVVKEWQRLPSRFAHLELDVFTLMPDHFHGILWLTERPDGEIPGPGFVPLRRAGSKPGSLPGVIQAFKSSSTYAAREITSATGWPGHGRRIWQRNYDEQLISSFDHLAAVRRYIDRNPVTLLRTYDAQGRRRS